VGVEGEERVVVVLGYILDEEEEERNEVKHEESVQCVLERDGFDSMIVQELNVGLTTKGVG
jgi:hypothetical protein